MTDASSQPGPEAEAGTDPRAAGGADPGPSASTGGSPEAGADPGILCANCGRPRAERFCPVCGQNDRTYTRSLLPVLGELVRESFEFDGRLAQTLKLLLFKPGSLSTEFSRNRRARYMTPVRLYLFSSVIFFLTMSVAMSLAPNPLDQDMALNGASSSLGEIPGDVVDSMEAAVPRLQVRMGDDSVATGRNARAAEADVEAFKAGIGPVQRERLDDVLASRSGRFVEDSADLDGAAEGRRSGGRHHRRAGRRVPGRTRRAAGAARLCVAACLSGKGGH